MPDMPQPSPPLDSPRSPAKDMDASTLAPNALVGEEQASTPESVSALDTNAPLAEPLALAPTQERVSGVEQNAGASLQESTAPENDAPPQSVAEETQSPLAPPAPSTARMRGRRSLPDSPLERAKLEAQSGQQIREASDKTTMVAFGLLFVVPVLIILLSLLFLLPFINSQLTEDPSGVDTQSISRGQTPSR